MHINIARSAGFCFGVKRAIDIALRTTTLQKPVYMLGDIVHNEQVVSQIKKAGIRTIKRLGSGTGKILLIRAHGTKYTTIVHAQKRGYTVIDATCPMVKEIHRIVQENERTCEKIIVIGDRHHDEVIGIVGQLKKSALVINSQKPLEENKLRGITKACVVVQSTQNIEKVTMLVTALKKYIPQLVFFNTICRPTRLKQAEIKQMPRDNDVILILGSKESANTKRLFEISHSLNKHTYWINAAKEINPRWFTRAANVGISAGASTPKSTIQEVIAALQRLSLK